eukprot:COSAG02_NODE_29521_length_567_cov_2.126068_1_plen_184_part_10
MNDCVITILYLRSIDRISNSSAQLTWGCVVVVWLVCVFVHRHIQLYEVHLTSLLYGRTLWAARPCSHAPCSLSIVLAHARTDIHTAGTVCTYVCQIVVIDKRAATSRSNQYRTYIYIHFSAKPCQNARNIGKSVIMPKALPALFRHPNAGIKLYTGLIPRCLTTGRAFSENFLRLVRNSTVLRV